MSGDVSVRVVCLWKDRSEVEGFDELVGWVHDARLYWGGSLSGGLVGLWDGR